MPVVFRDSGLRYYFFSNEGSPREAPHVHVKSGDRDAKIWLDPASVARINEASSGMDLTAGLRRIPVSYTRRSV